MRASGQGKAKGGLNRNQPLEYYRIYSPESGLDLPVQRRSTAATHRLAALQTATNDDTIAPIRWGTRKHVIDETRIMVLA
jgi:hypothetical protein